MTNSRRVAAASLVVAGSALLITVLAVPRPSADIPSRAAPATAAATASTGAIGGVGRGSAAAAPAHRSLILLDFLPQVAEAVELDAIAGHPDAAELVPFLGEPTAFGSDVATAGGSDDGGITRCGLVAAGVVDSMAAAFNDRLAVDQRLDPSAAETRTLLHWNAAEGLASVRIFAIDGPNPPSCADAAELT